MRQARALWEAYKLRLKRKRLLWRAFRARRHLTCQQDNTARIAPDAILAFVCLRNEAARLPYFLAHYRALGVQHFLVVDNASSDESAALLRAPDISVWRTEQSYRRARFGMDWLNWLLMRYGHGHWCLTVDADEILIYQDHETLDLRGLTARLGAPSMAAMMLDLYPKGPLSSAHCPRGADPSAALGWFDPTGYSYHPLPKFDAVSIRGGPRHRAFFAQTPEAAPHLHKTPLILWHRRYAYLSSTHIALPRRLNRGFADQTLPTGVLLHNKFLDQVIEKSAEEKQRQEHFTHVERYGAYYDQIIADPVLWTETSAKLEGWAQLKSLGLLRGFSQD